MRKILLILVPLTILVIALTGAHILVERLFILIVLILLFSYLFARLGMRGLKGHIKNPGQHEQAGQSFQIEVFTENTSLWPKTFLNLRVKGSKKQPNKDLLINLPSKGNYYWQNRLSYPQRGHYQLGPLLAEFTDPFGLFRLQRKLDKVKDILIYPATVELPLFSAESKAESGALRNNWLTNESGGTISGVREYVPGDSLNRVHWRSTAHMGKLIVKEFDVDLSENIWLIPDLSKDFIFGKGIESTEEYIVTIAASIVKKYADSGRQVGLIAQSNDYHFYPARPGNLNMWRILEALAVLKANGQIPLHRILNRAHEQFSGNSVVIIITASSRDEIVDSVVNIKRQGIPVVTILVDATSFGGSPSPKILETRLRALNLPIYIVKKGDNLAEVLNSQGINTIVSAGAKVHYNAG